MKLKLKLKLELKKKEKRKGFKKKRETMGTDRERERIQNILSLRLQQQERLRSSKRGVDSSQHRHDKEGPTNPVVVDPKQREADGQHGMSQPRFLDMGP